MAVDDNRLRPLIRRLRSRAGDEAEPPLTLTDVAQDAGWPVDGPRAAFLADLRTHLDASPAANVAVLMGAHPTPIGQIVTAAYPSAQVHSFGLGANRSTLHTRLAQHGPFDVLIDDTRHGDQHIRVLRDCFFHLRAGGALVVRDYRSEPDPRRTHAPVGDLLSLLFELLGDRHENGASVVARRRDQVMLAKSVGEVTVGERHLVLTNAVTAYAKMREDEVNRVLKAEPAVGRVLATVPGLEFASRAVSRTGADHDDRRRPKTFTVPMLSLREYTEVVCAPGQVAIRGNLLLPDSYRHNQYPRLQNRWTIDLSPRFAQDPRLAGDVARLPGSYFYLDAEWPEHFGHVMTEQLPRMWGWARAKRANPDLKALLSLAATATELSPWQIELFGAAGIAEEDLVPFDAPVRVDKLVAATSMFSQPNYVHPDIEPLWDQMGRTLSAGARTGDYPTRIFVSRRLSGVRPCHNVADVEQRFVSSGFTVLYPEDIPLSDQAETFRRADVIGGFAGSGMFSLSYCETPKRVIAIAPESYTAINEHMISAVRGHDIDQIWSVPDIPQPSNGWNYAAFFSGFTFDFDREGIVLDQVLAALDS